MTVTIDLRRRKTSLERSGLHSPLSAGATGPARAAQEKHLLLQLNASALGLHLTTLARFHVPVYMMSQNVRRLDVSFLPGRLWPAGREDAGKEGPAPPALAAAQVWLWRVLLAISRMLCSITVSRVMLPTVSDLGRKSQARREVARHPPFSRRDGWSGRSGT